MFRRFFDDEDGATAIEYALIAALISVVALAAFRKVGLSFDARMTDVGTALDGAL